MTRAIWPLILLVIAVIAAGAQFDRQTRIDPHLSGKIPAPFRSFAQANRVASALKGPSPDVALIEARRLVRLRPMEANHLRMLAQAQLAKRNERTGAATLQIAGRLGWHDAPTQYGVLQLAMAAGDDAEAARRLAAVWAVSEDRKAVAPLAITVLASKASQAEFARLLRADPRWRAKVSREAPLILPSHLTQAILPDQ